MDVHVGRDVAGLVGRVHLPRPRVELHDHLDRLVNLLDRLAQLARDRGVILPLQVAQVSLDDGDDELVAADVLQEQTLLEGARGHADRIEVLDLPQDPLAQLPRRTRFAHDFFQGGVPQVPVAVQVAEDEHGDRLLVRLHRGHVELPDEMIEQR